MERSVPLRLASALYAGAPAAARCLRRRAGKLQRHWWPQRDSNPCLVAATFSPSYSTGCRRSARKNTTRLKHAACHSIDEPPRAGYHFAEFQGAGPPVPAGTPNLAAPRRGYRFGFRSCGCRCQNVSWCAFPPRWRRPRMCSFWATCAATTSSGSPDASSHLRSGRAHLGGDWLAQLRGFRTALRLESIMSGVVR